ncbi:MAG: Molybdenum ABC transporter, periplasmic molybdenum-binding protein ModA [Nitrospira sp.]|nr:MAG: Molybdenum ABC transporter, periplasmic molybdenum-binding protein ModA [Nitrospira sp.]
MPIRKSIRPLWAVTVILAMTLMLGMAKAATVAYAGEVTIAAASDLNFAIKELIEEFEKQSGNKVKLSLGSSGNFFAQLQQGAPFDLYFSADIGYPRKLEEAGLTAPGTLYRYAVGRVVLWAPKSSPLDVTKGLTVLREPAIKKIAIANPKHAPYGRAAVAAMEHEQVYGDVKDRLVLGENISQAAQFIESGACDVGIIALSLAMAPAMKSAGNYWEIPADHHTPLEQGAVVMKQSKNQEIAKQFLEFMKGERGQEIMTRYGFTLPS